jgi:PBP1b-binding outer membrane lipoprotein LpoB
MSGFKKSLSLILIIASVIVFSACSLQSATKMSDSETDMLKTESKTETIENKETDIAEIPDSDFNGYKFVILVRDSNLDSRVYLNYNVLEETGDLINDAIYRRNRAAEDKLNIEI